MGQLDGKIAIVTGGTSGLGRATVVAMAGEGATIVFTGRNQDGADETLRRLRAAGQDATYLPHDVTLEDDWRRVITDTMAQHGRLDTLINNAGVSRLKPMEKLSLDDLDFLLKVNVEGMFL